MKENETETRTRREFLRALTMAGGASALAASVPSASAQGSTDAEAHGKAMAKLKPGAEKIIILLFPGFTALDAIGPEYILSTMSGAKVQFIAKTTDPVPTETGFLVTPNLSFDQCPDSPDLFLIPGGTVGLLTALEDREMMDFIRKTGADAKLTGSVCTGSLLLGAAGLLRDYKAASHWQTVELLPLSGAKPSKERVVFDRDRVTGAGVTAGLDLALELVRRYRGDFYAQGVQLLAQYDPAPPFPNGGNPAKAEPEVVKLLDEMHHPFIAILGEAIKASHAPEIK